MNEQLKKKIEEEVSKMNFNSWTSENEKDNQRAIARIYMKEGATLAQEWISFKDAKPDDSQGVLTYDPMEREIYIHQYRDSGYFEAHYSHWLPLPSPPSNKA